MLRSIALHQAARFTQRCRMFAPATASTLAGLAGEDIVNPDGYADVSAALDTLAGVVGRQARAYAAGSRSTTS